tara:strand:+ start:1053 stop:1598 length:546 start_codon:yes stop_codon:yes gene_type:complete
MSNDHEAEVESLSSEISVYGKIAKLITPDLMKGEVAVTDDPKLSALITSSWFNNKDQTVRSVSVPAVFMQEALLASSNSQGYGEGNDSFLFMATYFKDGEGVAVLRVEDRTSSVEIDGVFYEDKDVRFIPVMKLTDLDEETSLWLRKLRVLTASLRASMPKPEPTEVVLAEEQEAQIGHLI